MFAFGLTWMLTTRYFWNHRSGMCGDRNIASYLAVNYLVASMQSGYTHTRQKRIRCDIPMREGSKYKWIFWSLAGKSEWSIRFFWSDTRLQECTLWTSDCVNNNGATQHWLMRVHGPAWYDDDTFRLQNLNITILRTMARLRIGSVIHVFISI